MVIGQGRERTCGFAKRRGFVGGLAGADLADNLPVEVGVEIEERL